MSNHDHPEGKFGDIARDADMLCLHGTEFGKQTWNPETTIASLAGAGECQPGSVEGDVEEHIAALRGECHAPPANIYDVLSRFKAEADKLGQMWIDPTEVSAIGQDGGSEPYFFLDNRYRRLDVAVTDEGVVCYHGYRLHSGGGSVVPRTLVTPFDYSRAYTWLIQGDQP